MQPLIAVTALTYAGEGHRVPQIMLGVPYVAAIEATRATALLLTPAHPPDSLERLLNLVHGLVLTGGEDIDPRRYGETAHPSCGLPNIERDEMEFAVLESALERRLPLLAICRGMQLLNVALGGTLYQDLPSQRPGPLLHEQEAAIDKRWHSARVEPDSTFAQVVGTKELFINSFHHQGIKDLAPGLRAIAWAEDGLVEGVEIPGHPWAVGVQWHPERGEAESRGDRRHPDRRLFWALTAAAAERAAMERIGT